MRRDGTVVLHDRSVDLATGRISTGPRLRPLELRVLQLLADHVGRVVAQDTILVEALGYAPATRSHTLYTTMYRLRAALEADPADPRHLVAVRGAGYRLEDVGSEPAALTDAPLTNLAPESDRFVGRADLLARLAALDAPVVTLLGPGGSGKTRLAIHHAARAPMPGGVWFVPLEDRELGGVVDAVHQAVRAPGPASVDSVVARLRAFDRSLVVLDGVEQLIADARSLVDAVRQRAPEARLLITSRTPLGIAGEHLVDVGALCEADAVALLTARAVEAGRDPAQADPPEALAALATRLDRLPLALELAAGRLGTVSAAVLLDQLDASAALCTTRGDRPARHRSLDAALLWTWDQLDPAEQEAIARLTAVDGAFGVAIATAVLGDDPDAASTVVRLHQLGFVSSSPIQQTKPFVALRTVQDAVRSRVPPELLADARDRVATFTLERAAQTIRPDSLPGWFDGDQSDAGTERTLRASWRRDGPSSEAGAVAWGEVLYRLRRVDEQYEVATEALRRSRDPAWSGRLRADVARAAADLGRDAEAVARWTEVQGDPSVEPVLRAYASLKLARRALTRAAFGEVEAQLAVSDARIAEIAVERRGWLPGVALQVRATLAMTRGEPAEALRAFDATDAAYLLSGAATKAALARVNAGLALWVVGRPLDAIAAYRDGLQRLVAIDDAEARTQIGVARVLLGSAIVDDSPDEGERELRRAVADLRRAGTLPWELGARAHLSIALTRRGQAEEGLALVRSVKAIAEEQRLPPVPVVRNAEMVALAASGRLTEALQAGELPLTPVTRFDLHDERMVHTEIYAELLLGAGRLGEARERVEQVVAELPPSLAPRLELIVLVAELRRWAGDRASALEAARTMPAAQLRPIHRTIATALVAALTAELGGPRVGFPDPSELPEGWAAGWLAVHRARIAKAPVGPRPQVPAYAFALALAVDEWWPR